MKKIQELSKNVPKFEEKYNSQVPEITKKQKPRIKKPINKLLFYIPPIVFFFITVIILIIIIFFVKRFDIWALLFTIVAIPVNIIGGIVLVARFIKDKNKITQAITPIFTKNFIVANFLTNNMRILKKLVKLNNDGISFDIGDRTYVVDKKTIWFDEKNHANSFYFPEIPNPLKLTPEAVIQKFLKAIRENKPNESLDFQGEVVDISFSSTNLQLFKKNKIFDELNKNPGAEKTQLALIGIVAFLIFALILAIIL